MHVLPSIRRTDRSGDILVSHFGFYTQEEQLLKTPLLDRYYEAAGLKRQVALPAAKRPTLRQYVRKRLEARFLSGDKVVRFG